VNLRRQPSGVSPRKRENSLPRRSLSAVGLKRLLAARAAPRKRKSSKKHPRKIRTFPWRELTFPMPQTPIKNIHKKFASNVLLNTSQGCGQAYE
jgi:hypothetical protein